VRNRIAIWFTTHVRDEQKIICYEQGLWMSDAHPSTKRQLHLFGNSLYSRTLAQNYNGGGDNLFNFAHLRCSSSF
jgi:hypothetical protein